MAKYQYTGFIPRVYLSVVIPGQGSLTAAPGDIVEFDSEPPADGFWVAVPLVEKKTKEVVSK